MTVVRHHADWLSLVDISGPFLSLQVLLRVFPQQLPQLDSGLSAQTRLAFTEWEDAAGDRAIHTAWLQYVLGTVLKFPDEVLLTGQGMPPGLEFTVAEHGEPYARNGPSSARKTNAPLCWWWATRQTRVWTSPPPTPVGVLPRPPRA